MPIWCGRCSKSDTMKVPLRELNERPLWKSRTSGENIRVPSMDDR